MIIVETISGGVNCTTEEYEGDVDTYRGDIQCIKCKKKAWFVRSYKTEKIDRMACFGAKHKDGCNASTILFSSDDEQSHEENAQSEDIRVDLDKIGSQSIYISEPNNKHGDEESDWTASKKDKAIGNASGFPLNKSLRQLLTNLCKNPEYGDKGQTINIVADSGVSMIKGLLSDHIVPLNNIKREHAGSRKIFWGTINNLNLKDGSLWLNYGNYNTEPSIILDQELRFDLLRNFKLKDVSELDGSDVIIVGNVGFSPRGKATIKTGFTKYMSFRRRKRED
ncbi:hypothetical protein [Moritella yayanosii]|uniref:Uncharacterized protein n=1 Tax=Moritella yayanosii TaxID=69539 RepID=A0A330LUJ6_9GAMM|nr:hypothetical protein [Moritella yayanosii]SQD80429.1 conserved protein of unknown function [Moritella yayanosii]